MLRQRQRAKQGSRVPPPPQGTRFAETFGMSYPCTGKALGHVPSSGVRVRHPVDVV